MCISIIDTLYFINISLSIIHRDIKLDNIVLDSNLQPIFIDFEYSIKYKDETDFVICGSPEYASPEMILGKQYTYKTDIWSFGVLLYISMYKSYPFFRHIDTIEKAHLFYKQNKKPKVMLNSSNSYINYILKSVLHSEPEFRMVHKEIIYYLNLYLSQL